MKVSLFLIVFVLCITWLTQQTTALSVMPLSFLRVVVFDTGLNVDDDRFRDILCNESHYDFTNKGLDDHVGHGTHVAGLIKQYANTTGYCLIIVKYTDSMNPDSSRYKEALNSLIEIRPDIVNISGGGESFIELEKNIITQQLPKTFFIVAAGNYGKNLSEKTNGYYPAQYSNDFMNVVAVGNLLPNGNRNPSSNYGLANMIWEMGTHVLSTLPNNQTGYETGTSMSTAIATGKLIRKLLHD